MTAARAQVNRLLTAVMFLTRLPVGRWVRYHPDELARSTPYFPVVGAVVGGIGAVALLAASRVASPPLTVLAAMLATVWATSAFHEDGLADAADGLGGGWGRDRILEIMHDSRIGTYGAVALWFLLTARLFLLLDLLARGPDVAAAALVAAHAAGRWSGLWLIHRYDYVHPAAGPAKPFAASVTRPRLLVGTAFAGAIVVAAVNWASPAAAAAAILTTLAAGPYFRARIGGITGDCLGATCVAAELAVYAALLAVRSG